MTQAAVYKRLTRLIPLGASVLLTPGATAAIGLLTPPTPLPESPALERLLFERSLLLILLLLLAGGAVAFTLLRSGRRAAGLGTLAAAIALAGGAYAAERAIETEGEQLESQTRALVAAVSDADADAMRGVLCDTVTIDLRSLAAIPVGREGLIAAVQLRLDGGRRVESWHISELQTTTDGPNVARTQVRVSTEGADSGRVASWWLIEWRRDRPDPSASYGPWHAAHIELVAMPFAGISANR